MKLQRTASAIKFTQFLCVSFLLTGCMFGQNEQHFEIRSQPGSSVTTGTSNLPSSGGGALPTITPAATSTPVLIATPTSTPLPSPTASASPSSPPISVTLPSPTATPGAHLPPVAHDDGPYEIAENQSLAISISDLLANDTDPNSLTLQFSSYGSPSSGTLSKSGDTLTFNPVHNFSGTVTFIYTVSNSLNLSSQATVTINVRIPASEAIYGESTSTLYRYDPNTQRSTAIASFRLGSTSGALTSLFDIAITANGLMYGVDGSKLYYVDANTGVLTQIQTTGLANFHNINGLTALSDGRLVISGDGIAIYDIAKQTLSTLLAPGTYTSSGDVIAMPDGYLYMSAKSSSDDHLVRIDATTGATHDMGSLGRTKVYGLGYAYGIMYGFDATEHMFQIDPSNAATSHVTDTGVTWYGATTNPVLW